MKIIILILCSLFFLLFDYYSPVVLGNMEKKPTQSTEPTIIDKVPEQLSDGRLVVNGQDITGNHNIQIYHPNGNVHIPLLAVAETLGAKTQWKDAKVATIQFAEETYEIDTTDDWFGIMIPPGASHAVRKVADNEIIIDYHSVRRLLKNLFNADVYIDYSEKVIYIYSLGSIELAE